MRHRLVNLLRLNARKGQFRAESNTIFLYDMIVADEVEAEWWGGVAPKPFIDTLRAMTGDVHIRINSPGGDVFGATAMMQAMREYQGGKIITHVDGLAASAASLIAITAAETIMAPGSMMMIHDAWTIGMGNRHDFIDTAALLEKVDGQLAQAYAKKAGGEASTFATLMDAETWLTPEEAVDAGLADAIAEDSPATGASAAAWNLAPFDKAPRAQILVPTVPEPEPEPEWATADDEIEARQRRHAVAMLLNAA